MCRRKVSVAQILAPGIRHLSREQSKNINVFTGANKPRMVSKQPKWIFPTNNLWNLFTRAIFIDKRANLGPSISRSSIPHASSTHMEYGAQFTQGGGRAAKTSTMILSLTNKSLVHWGIVFHTHISINIFYSLLLF